MVPQKPRVGYYKVDTTSGVAELLHDAGMPGTATRRPDLSRDGKTIFHGEIDADLLGTKLLRFDSKAGKRRY